MITVSKKLLLGTAVVGLIGAGALQASAHEVPQEAPAWRMEAHDALEAGDYAAWKSAHEQAFAERMTEEHFNELREFHQLMSDGKYDEAKEYAKQHDLGPRQQMGGKRSGMMRHMHQDTASSQDTTGS